jgi:metal-sulfur cluster biosynthetic enzyme
MTELAASPPFDSGEPSEDDAVGAVFQVLHEVIDPELGVNIVDLGLVYDVAIDGRAVSVAMTMTTPACPLGPYLTNAVEAAVWALDGVEQVDVHVVWDPPWNSTAMMSDEAKRQLGWTR